MNISIQYRAYVCTQLNGFKHLQFLILFVGSLYIYILSYKDNYVVSQHFTVARHTRYFNLGARLGWLYISRTYHPITIHFLNVREGIFTYFILKICYRLLGVLNFYEELLHFSLCGSLQVFFSHRMLNPPVRRVYIYIYIYSHPQIDLFRSIRTHQCG